MSSGAQSAYSLQAPKAFESRATGATVHNSEQLRFRRELTKLRTEVIKRQAANGGVLAEADRAELQARLDRLIEQARR